MSDVSYAGPLNQWLAQAPPQPPPRVMGKSVAELLGPYLADSNQAQAAAEAAAQRVRAPYARANEHVSGLPDIGTVLGNTIASAITAPRDALTGAMHVTDPETGMPTREALERGQSVANLAMTGGMPFARPGAAGMAGGKLTQPGDRIGFQSAGAQRSEATGSTAPRLTEAEEAAARQRSADYQAKLKERLANKLAAEPAKPAAGGERVGFKSLGTAKQGVSHRDIIGTVKSMESGPRNYVSIKELKKQMPDITDKEIIALADQGKLTLAPYGGSAQDAANQVLIRDDQGNRFIGVGRP